MTLSLLEPAVFGKPFTSGTMAMRIALEKINLRVGGEPYLNDIELSLEPGSLNVLLKKVADLL